MICVRPLPLALVGVSLSAVVLDACRSRPPPYRPPPPQDDTAGAQILPIPATLASGVTVSSPHQASGPHPRILLTAERLARARRNRELMTEAWRAVTKACDQAGESPARSGYEGWDWGNYMADCALVWQVTHDTRAARVSLQYLTALVTDRERIGDGQGGDEAARHDHGYAIRTYGFYSALGYDWLHDAPGMTDAMREKIRGRLNAWLGWYAENGYRRQSPVSNYFMGYFATLAYSAFATGSENEKNWTPALEELVSTRVVPAYAKLAGGDWPEGWQYGDGAATMMALFVDGERTARHEDRLADIPWLPAVVAHHAHAILPDGVRAYDNGDWTSRPTRMPSRALDVLALILPESDDRAKRSRFLARKLRTPRDEWKWIVPIADEPAALSLDPRTGAASYLAPGTGLVLARSTWDRDATFVSLQAGPSFADADHQHADQGHFEIVRGTDALFIDPGDYTSFATLNHNALLVDDHHDALDYCPNQGLWGRESRVTAFVDRGDYVYARGDIGDAYRPSKFEYGTRRSVLFANRDWLFIRPSTLALFDRVRLAKSDYGAVWLGHTSVRPETRDNEVRAYVGSSRVEMSTLLPEHPTRRILAEPTNTETSPFLTNQVYGRSFRIEIAADPGPNATFLHVIRATRMADETDLRASLIPAEGGAAARITERTGTVVVAAFASEPSLRITTPATARLLLVGLLANASYACRTESVPEGCRISVEPGQGHTADAGGTLDMELRECVMQ